MTGGLCCSFVHHKPNEIKEIHLHIPLVGNKMTKCCVMGCPNSSKASAKERSFHKFPQDPILRQEWIRRINRDHFHLTKYSLLCSDHFQDSCFEPCGVRRRLKYGAIPDIFEDRSISREPEAETDSDRFEHMDHDESASESSSSDEEFIIPDVKPNLHFSTRKVVKLDHCYAMPKRKVTQVQVKNFYYDNPMLHGTNDSEDHIPVEHFCEVKQEADH